MPDPEESVPILRIPFSADDREFIHDGIDDILDSGYLSQGDWTDTFEQEYAEFTGMEEAVACSNGTTALELILRGLDVEDSSVIVPTNTFLATAFAVLHSGNRVVFADSDPATLALDVEDVAARITDDTAAVILVHIGGVVTPAVDELRTLCEEQDVHLIEDAAHAHGSAIDGERAGSLGVAGAFSFYPTKVATTGEGGMITTDDAELARRARMIRNHGKNPALDNRMSEIGHNFRLSELTALLGVQQTRTLEEKLAERREIAAFYDEHLADVPGIEPLQVPDAVVSSYYKYVAYIPEEIDRELLKSRLHKEYDVSLTGEVYADLCHTEPLWDEYTFCGSRKDGDGGCSHGPECAHANPRRGFPGATEISERHICLPIYPGLSTDERRHVVASVDAVLSEMTEVSA